MITVTYSADGIHVKADEISKYNKNLPLTVNIKKHVSGELQWSGLLNDNWFATYPNTEMFDIEITDSKANLIYIKTWDIMEHGTHFYKSLWLYNKHLLAGGIFPRGLVIGTHDGEFGEWVPVVKKRECEVVLVEASDSQFQKLKENYSNNSRVKLVQKLITPTGGEVEFFEGGKGYTNSVVESVIKNWETEEIRSTRRESIGITDLILNECGGRIDWLHLDVEGLDADLIMAIDQTWVLLPGFIIFEDYNLSTDKKSQIYNWLTDKGYQIYSNGGICEAILHNK